MVLNIPGPGTRKPVGKSRTTLSIERSELGSRGLSPLSVGSSPAEVEARGDRNDDHAASEGFEGWPGARGFPLAGEDGEPPE